MKHIPLILLFFLSGTSIGFGQRYGTAVGMRLGTDWGLTVQQRVARHLSAEFIAQSSLQREEILLTAMVQQHNPVLGRRFNLYFGGGLHKGWISADPETGIAPRDPFGITLIGGLEFSLGRLNLSYDLKPAINISGGEKNFYTQSGISIRYIVQNEKEQGWHKNRRKKRSNGFLQKIFGPN